MTLSNSQKSKFNNILKFKKCDHHKKNKAHKKSKINLKISREYKIRSNVKRLVIKIFEFEFEIETNNWKIHSEKSRKRSKKN